MPITRQVTKVLSVKGTKKIVGAKAETLNMEVKRKRILCPKPNIRNNFKGGEVIWT